MKEVYSKIYCNQTDREGLVHARKFFPVRGCKESHSLCTDVPPPSGKIGRGDVCESPSLIVFRYTFA